MRISSLLRSKPSESVFKQQPPDRYVANLQSLIGGNSVRLLHDGREVFPEIRALFSNATTHIHIEMYFWNSDPFGWEMADLLAAAAQRGVIVRLLVDAAGCVDTQIDIFDSLEKRGVHVKMFHPLAPWRPRWSWNNRTHRKIIMADGKIAIIGGLNISGEYAAVKDDVNLWRDCAFRIEGPAVGSINQAFSHSWASHTENDTGGRRFLNTSPPGIRNGSDGKVRSLPSPDTVSSCADGVEQPAADVVVIPTGTPWPKNGIERAVVFAIKHAKTSVYIACAYFIPGAQLRRALRKAARRGVDVRLLLPSESTDIKTVYYASRHLYARLLRSNIRIYEWCGDMLHAKMVIVDSTYVLVGSANLDPRSRYHNYELSVATINTKIGLAAHQRFMDDLTKSKEVKRESWLKRGFGKQLLERIAFLFRYWL
ncbi:MAG: hypothetical protein HUU55_03725 [Myxococcales bacterium]|nr:hypothetical protein [Myxococcales bacterium]